MGLIGEGSVNLTRWIDHIQTKAKIAQSTQKRLSRWVNNPRINPAKLYSPIVKAVFANWSDPEIYLTFDTSMLWDEYCLIRICVVHLGRAIPVGWRVIKHKSSSVKLETYQDLLKRVAKLLPSQPKIVLLADRGFADAQLVRYVRQLGWQCRIRIKGNFLLRHPRLVMAMTTLFLTATGVQVVVTGQRRLVDPHWFRGSSYLKIGWSWVKRAMINGWDLLSDISFTTNIDPAPVKASHSQYLQKMYRIEFTAHTYIWS